MGGFLKFLRNEEEAETLFVPFGVYDQGLIVEILEELGPVRTVEHLIRECGYKETVAKALVRRARRSLRRKNG